MFFVFVVVCSNPLEINLEHYFAQNRVIFGVFNSNARPKRSWNNDPCSALPFAFDPPAMWMSFLTTRSLGQTKVEGTDGGGRFDQNFVKDFFVFGHQN